MDSKRIFLRSALACAVATLCSHAGLALAVNDEPLRDNWAPSEWGPDDKAGAANRRSAASVLKAMKLVNADGPAAIAPVASMATGMPRSSMKSASPYDRTAASPAACRAASSTDTFSGFMASSEEIEEMKSPRHQSMPRFMVIATPSLALLMYSKRRKRRSHSGASARMTASVPSLEPSFRMTSSIFS